MMNLPLHLVPFLSCDFLLWFLSPSVVDTFFQEELGISKRTHTTMHVGMSGLIGQGYPNLDHVDHGMQDSQK